MLTKNEQNLLILIFFMVVYFTWKMNNLEKKSIENFDNSPVYAGDIEAVEKLSNFAIKLSEGSGNITVPGKVTFTDTLTASSITAVATDVWGTGRIKGGIIQARADLRVQNDDGSSRLKIYRKNDLFTLSMCGWKTSLAGPGASEGNWDYDNEILFNTDKGTINCNNIDATNINTTGNITVLSKTDVSGNWISGGSLKGRWVSALDDFVIGSAWDSNISTALNSWALLPRGSSQLKFCPRIENETGQDKYLWDDKKNLITFDGLIGGIKSNEINCNKISGASAVGAWIYMSTNNCGPIYSSIRDYEDYDYNNKDIKYIVMPGYRLDVYSKISSTQNNANIDASNRASMDASIIANINASNRASMDASIIASMDASNISASTISASMNAEYVASKKTYTNTNGTKPKLFKLSASINKGRSCKLYYKDIEILEIEIETEI
jgi:hypothetical protein